MNKYTPIIGLEVHVELKTESKMFCRCSADYFGKEPNTHTCPVCLGLPGALPVPNKTAIEWCVKIALALNCKINEFSKFDRKNYFYPDLAKGYQISQYDLPFGYDGITELKSGKKMRIRRVHMEEDTGKLTHENGASLVDFNRSGLPLVEIVTEPDFHDAEDVKEYLQNLQQIVRYLDVSNADMEKGDMRLEPNISLALTTTLQDGTQEIIPVELLPNYKVEVKNINSFKFVEKAINYEVKRQTELLDKGERPAQETRGWDSVKQRTFSQRSKEDAQEYRYFPEPDIPPITHTKEQISSILKEVPELPAKKIARFEKEYGISFTDAEILSREKLLADYFEKVTSLRDHEVAKQSQQTPQAIAKWIINKKVDYATVTPEVLLKHMAAAKQTVAIDEQEFDRIAEEVFSENPQAVAACKSGKDSVIMFLVGQFMKKIGKKVDAQLVRKKLQEKL